MEVRYRDVLRSHAERILQFDFPIVELTLMSKSVLLRDVIAFLATGNTYTSDELKDSISTQKNIDSLICPDWLAAYGWTVASQMLEEDDTEIGLECLQIAKRLSPRLPQVRPYNEFLAALLFETGDLKAVRSLVRDHKALQRSFHNYLEDDTWNPFLGEGPVRYEQWLAGFNRPLVSYGLAPISLASDKKRPFDRICAEPSREPIFAEPKVSVIMTSYMPERDAFLLAAESILQQSWQNLELIVVDDATPGSTEVLAELEASDDRVRVIKQPANFGTYRARNIGLEAATGEFVTGQDSDDWSHPDRLHSQLKYLTEHPEIIGVRTRAVRAYDNLVRVNRGKHPITNCEISFMVPTWMAREVGGYLPARKAADTEFRRRVERVFGNTARLDAPLYIARLSADSLSRGDFGAGWSHPARRAFRSAFTLWHKQTEPADLRSEIGLTTSADSPVKIPSKFHISAPAQKKLDVIFVADWRVYEASQRAMLDEIQAVIRAGYTVGIMHLESIMTYRSEFWLLHDRVQQMINDDVVTQIMPDDGAEADVLVLHDPLIVQFLSPSGISISVDHVLLMPTYPPCAKNGDETLYDPRIVTEQSRTIFDAPVTWAALDPAIKEALAAYGEDLRLHQEALMPTFDKSRWTNYRHIFTGPTPVVGRHSERLLSLWPTEPEDAELLWPTQSKWEIRILGDGLSPAVKYGEPTTHSRWVAFDDGLINPEAFMRALDVFVYFPDSRWPQQFCRPALEAEAAGCIVILPEQFRKMHGEGALYAQPQEVPVLIKDLVNKPDQHLRSLSDDGANATSSSRTTEGRKTTSALILTLLNKNRK